MWKTWPPRLRNFLPANPASAASRRPWPVSLVNKFAARPPDEEGREKREERRGKRVESLYKQRAPPDPLLPLSPSGLRSQADSTSPRPKSNEVIDIKNQAC